MRALAGAPQELPAPLDALRRSLRGRILRVEALERAGGKAPEDVAAARARIESMWTRALDSDASLSAADRAHWRARLMSP